VALFGIASMVIPAAAAEPQVDGSTLQQPISGVLQEEPPAEVSPSDKPKVVRRPARAASREEIRAAMLKRSRELRLAKLKPMWGDFFGGLPFIAQVPDNTASTEPPPQWPREATAGAQFNIAPGGGVSFRRIKLAEGNSPLPTDRWIANYSFFNDVLLVGDVNRYTLGFERTFDEGLKSIELRLPIASTLSADQVANTPLRRSTQIGNLSLAYKKIIGVRGPVLTCAGLGLALPTAADSRLLNDEQEELIRVDNQSVHLLPFVSWIWTRNDRLTWQAFVQLDVDAGGNPVVIAGSNGPAPAGRLRDVTLLFVDMGFTYRWLEDREGLIRSVTPFAEIHYSGTLEDAPGISFGAPDQFQIDLEPLGQRYDVVNLSLGAHLQMGERLFVRPGIVIPLRSRDLDRQFDYEVGVQISVLH
jgi:hypothetical protein